MMLPALCQTRLPPLASDLYKDEKFKQFLIQYICSNASSNNIHYGKTDAVVTSALIKPIKTGNELNGFILFINKKTEHKAEEEYSPYFCIHNELIVLPGTESLYRYKLLKAATKNRELLLSRIRHEIKTLKDKYTEEVRKLEQKESELSKLKQSIDDFQLNYKKITDAHT